MSREIDAFQYAPAILSELRRHGVLITAKAGGEVNSMTIGWGTLGVEWGTPLFVCYVRTGRHTHGLIERSGEFSVNVPLFSEAGDTDADKRARRILAVCGTKSGRDMDKASELGLSLVPGEKIAAPGIAELPLTLECRVLYKREQDISQLPQTLLDCYYPQDVPSEDTGSNRDAHTAYYGEIVGARILG